MRQEKMYIRHVLDGPNLDRTLNLGRTILDKDSTMADSRSRTRGLIDAESDFSF